MKILVLGRVSPRLGGSSVGGIAKHTEDLCLCLESRGHEVVFFDYTLNKSYSIGGINIQGVSWLIRFKSSLIFLLNLISDLKLLRYYGIKDFIKISIQFSMFKKLIKDCDLVHIHSIHEPIIGFINKSDLSKVLVTDHGFWQKQNSSTKKGKAKLRFHLESVKRVLYISDFAYRRWNEFGLVDSFRDKFVKFSNPVKVSDRSLEEISKYRNTIFFNGFSESIERKGLSDFLTAIDHPDFSRYCIKIICNKKGQKLIGERYQHLDNLEVTGKISYSEIVSIYHNSCVMVLPSRSESFGLVYIEALLAGCPVVGFENTIKEFQVQMSIDIGEPYDPKVESPLELRNKILTVLSRVYDSKKLSAAVVDQYSWDKRVDDLVGIYHDILTK